jgi:hypothetical protein
MLLIGLKSVLVVANFAMAATIIKKQPLIMGLSFAKDLKSDFITGIRREKSKNNHFSSVAT